MSFTLKMELIFVLAAVLLLRTVEQTHFERVDSWGFGSIIFSCFFFWLLGYVAMFSYCSFWFLRLAYYAKRLDMDQELIWLICWTDIFLRSFTPQQLNCRKFNWKTADWKTSLISSPASSEIRFISFEYLQYPHGISASLFSFLLQQASISCSVISLKLRSWFLQLRLSHYCIQFHFHLTTLFLIITAVVIIFINNLRSNRIKRHHFVSSKLYIHLLQAFCVCCFR